MTGVTGPEEVLTLLQMRATTPSTRPASLFKSRVLLPELSGLLFL